MSYSARGTAKDGQIVEWEPQPQQGYGEAESNVDLDMSRAIIESMASHLTGECIVSVNGHSNPDRTPEGNWATDYMNVSVTRKAG